MSDARMPRVRLREFFLNLAFDALRDALSCREHFDRRIADAIALVDLVAVTPPDVYSDDVEPEPVINTGGVEVHA